MKAQPKKGTTDDTPQVGRVDFGSLRRTSPLSRNWGYERGTPIDRYYIERFLSENRTDVRGRVLEVAGNEYTKTFGGSAVVQSDVLHYPPGNANATIVDDLSVGDSLPSDAFDCILLTQTIHEIYELRPTIRTLHRILKPGGVLLVTAPGICQIDPEGMAQWGDYWRFTSRSLGMLFREVFDTDAVSVLTFGNVFAATAFLYGLCLDDLTTAELDIRDGAYQLVICLRAVKSESHPAESSGSG